MKKYVFAVIAVLISTSVYASCPKFSPYGCKVVGYKANGQPVQQCGCGVR